MTARADAFFLVWSFGWAAYLAACLLLGLSWWYGLPLALHLTVLALTVRDVRRRWRALSHRQRWARLHLRADAWAAVLEDRDARGASGVRHARLGLTRALDLANAERARLA